MIRICEKCNKEFSVQPKQVRRGGGKFCSHKCYGLARIKLEKRNCLQCKNEFQIIPAKIRYGWGKFCSRKCKGEYQKKLTGKNNPNWRGGISKENDKLRHNIEIDLWKNSVFARDNWICQKTGIKGGKLCCHHIKNFAEYPELRTSIENGITLSEKAHKEFHHKYGIKNNTEEQLEEFLKLKVGHLGEVIYI